MLSALGTEVKSTVLPRVTTCPLCNSDRLHCYSDPVCGGEWFHCRGCNRYGDMIELSAAAWKLEIPITVRKLADMGLPIPEAARTDVGIEAYHTGYVRKRLRALEFWRQCQQNSFCCRNQLINDLQRSLGAHTTLDPEAWLQCGGQFLGATTKLAFNTFAAPTIMANRDIVRPPTPGHRGKDRNKGSTIIGPRRWADAVITPYWDLPGRISGFFALGALQDGVDTLFYPVSPERQYGCPPREAGMAFLPAALQTPHKQLGSTVVVFTDPYLALRLQIRHLKDSTRPLPLVATHKSHGIITQLPWDWLPSEDIVLWSAQPDLQTILYARQADARVSTYTISQGEVERAMKTNHR